MGNGTTTSGPQNPTLGAPPAIGERPPAGESLSEWIKRYWKLYRISILGVFVIFVMIIAIIVAWKVLPRSNAVSSVTIEEKLSSSADTASNESQRLI
jgi:hypothetical protein